MSIGNIDVEELLASVKKSLNEDKNISPGLRISMEMMIVLVGLLLTRLGLNSKNSSKPPSADPNRKKQSRATTGRQRGGQHGRTGTTLRKTADPDEIREIPIDRGALPPGKYTEGGYESRQVFDIDISVVVTEYRAQILCDKNGAKFTAPFPAGVDCPVQYGNAVKAHAVYLSQYQLLPYGRIGEYFSDRLGLPLSAGTVHNFNRKAYERLAAFEKSLRERLIAGEILHADETGINIDGKGHWLHVNSNVRWTFFFPHHKRGKEAMDAMGVLPHYRRKFCHDHWKPYYRYGDVTHALCNSHHLRELEAAYELDGQQWARKMQALLLEINRATEQAGGMLLPEEAWPWREKYRLLLEQADTECPPPTAEKPLPGGKKQRGRLKRTKSRNLLERLREFEDDTLRFMEDKAVPFTNNLGERDIRMTKVHQKISGCFRSEEGAKTFCRIRSYLSSAGKQNISASYALQCLFEGNDIFGENRAE